MSQRPVGIVVVSLIMILFGIAEVITGFSHRFFGLFTAASWKSTYRGAALGLLYLAAGLLALTMTRRALYLAVAVLVLDIVGRVAMVALGFYPLTSTKQTFSIIAGTVIAAAFAIYLMARRNSYDA